jgi:ribosomal protein S3
VGQKTHPKGFRLITTQKHLSEWYSHKSLYPSLIEEDFFIRFKVLEIFSDVLSISKIEINRLNEEIETQEYINITIHALFPRAKEMSRKVSKYFADVSDKITSNPYETPYSDSTSLKEKGNENNIIRNFSAITNSKENLKRFTGLLLKRTIRNFIRFLQLKTKKNYYINIKFIKNPFEDATLIAKFIAEQLEKRIPFRRAVKQTIKKVKRTEMKGVKVQVSGRLNGIDIARSEWKRDGQVPLHTLKAKIDYTHQTAQTIYGLIGIKVWLFQGNEEK